MINYLEVNAKFVKIKNSSEFEIQTLWIIRERVLMIVSLVMGHNYSGIC